MNNIPTEDEVLAEMCGVMGIDPKKLNPTQRKEILEAVVTLGKIINELKELNEKILPN
jgi:hypothetical protein